jgi:DNA (cytosine-5)-methyltransferase 1
MSEREVNNSEVRGPSESDSGENSPSGDPASYWAAVCKTAVWPTPTSNLDSLKVVDLFCGFGGLSLGAAMAAQELGLRIEIALAADIWEEAIAVYKDNFDHLSKRTLVCDLGTLVDGPGSTSLSSFGKETVASIGAVDVLVAGPPCQGNSDLNNSSRRSDPRNSLYSVPVAVALAVRPKIVLIENVPPVVHSAVDVVGLAQSELIDAGYSVVEFVADAQAFGLPQTRKRHCLVASRVHEESDLGRVLGMIRRPTRPPRLWPFIKDLEFEEPVAGNLLTSRSGVSDENRKRIDFLFEHSEFDLPNHLRPSCHRDKKHSYVSMYGRLRQELPAQTITSGFGSMGQGRFVHPTQRRMITAHEAARIQGIPDYFSFRRVAKLTALREMIGNAVAPPVAATLVKLLVESGRDE